MDIFKTRKDIILHICGLNPNENKFHKIYHNHLFNTPNIINHGFVDLKSNIFIQIMNICGFLIFPSASEGCSPSALTVMGNGGLIPIISKESGLNIKKFGFILNNLQQKTVENSINKALQMSSYEFYKQSKQSLEFANTYHSFEKYSQKMENAIKQIIKK